MNTNNQKPMHYTTVNSIIKQLKQDIEISKARFIVSLKYSNQETQALNDLETAQQKFKQLRECKLSDLHMIIKQGELV